MALSQYYALAEYYDLIEHYVDYDKQCDFMEAVFKKYGTNVRRILDLGCGTGIHAIKLAKRGYSIVGLDLSEKMLEVARRKAECESLAIKFTQGDMREIKFKDEFDAIISVGTFDHLLTNDDVRRTLTDIWGGLRRGGLFIFKFICPLVFVISEGHWSKNFGIRHVEEDSLIIEQISMTKIDVYNHRFLGDSTIFVTKDGITTRYHDEDIVRFFFIPEMKGLLESCDLIPLEICDEWDLDKKDMEGINIVTVARKS
jgi:SAM-dependent methyltransferase